MMDDNCPKHVEFYSKNKFEKLVHLVGFIIRMDSNTHYTTCAEQLLCVLTFLTFSWLFELNTSLCYWHTNTAHWARQ